MTESEDRHAQELEAQEKTDKLVSDEELAARMKAAKSGEAYKDESPAEPVVQDPDNPSYNEAHPVDEDPEDHIGEEKPDPWSEATPKEESA